MDGVEHTSLDSGEAADNAVADDVVVSWDGLSLACHPGKESVIQSVLEDGELLLPELPVEAASLERVYWPLESLLVRTFSLPLSETRLLDAAILSQELAELSGEDSEQWWLAWHAEKTDEGIAGIVFGLPQSLRKAMADDPVWQQCPKLLVDGWERLTVLSAGFETCAVIDEDSEGIFFGFLQRGVWRGIRRINREVSDNVSLSDAEIAQQIRYSWKAMGVDASGDTPDDVIGQVGQPLSDILMPDYSHWQVKALDELSSRHHVNFALKSSLDTQLNFRHGKWAAQKNWYAFKQWKRPLIMAAGLLLIWLGVTIASIYSLESQADMYRSDIESAFHRGLPDEHVMLDPLAQLKKATGTSGIQQERQKFLEQLQVLSQVHQKTSWQLHEISSRNGEIRMSGSAKDIDSLNRMRDQLQQRSGQKVVITNTDLSDNRVSFWMKW